MNSYLISSEKIQSNYYFSFLYFLSSIYKKRERERKRETERDSAII